MKFLHAADIHLDSPLLGLERYEGAPVDLIRGASRRAFENLVDLAIREKVDFVVIAGDLYDGDWRDFNTGMFFIRQVARLVESGIPIYLIAGNHDAANTMTRKLRLPENPEGDSMMLSHDRAETRRLDDLGVAIHGRSFANQSEKQNMVPDYPAPIPHVFNLGLLHTSLNGSEEHDTYAPCTPIDLKGKGYDYWALGHIHKRSLPTEADIGQSGSTILFSGNLQGRHIREPGPRGCYLVTVDDRHQSKTEFRPLDVFRWENCVVSCTDLTSTDDILKSVEGRLRFLMKEHGALPLGVRVILEGATRAHQELTSHRERIVAEIRSRATIVSNESIWIEQVKIRTDYPKDRQLLDCSSGPVGELVHYLDQLADDEAAMRELSEEFKDLARKLPAEMMDGPDGIQLDRIEWLKEMVKELKPMLLDKLTGEAGP